MTNVLVVDDDVALVRLLALILRSERFDVDASTSAEDGLDIIRDHEPDLVVLDLAMPGMDARSFYVAARELGYCGPVLSCSAYGASAARRELGADAALDKPFSPEDLLAKVHSLV